MFPFCVQKTHVSYIGTGSLSAAVCTGPQAATVSKGTLKSSQPKCEPFANTRSHNYI